MNTGSKFSGIFHLKPLKYWMFDLRLFFRWFVTRNLDFRTKMKTDDFLLELHISFSASAAAAPADTNALTREAPLSWSEQRERKCT